MSRPYSWRLNRAVWYKPDGIVCLRCRELLNGRMAFYHATTDEVRAKVRAWHRETGALMYKDAMKGER